MRKLIIAILLVTPCFAQSQPEIQDLKDLVGKKVVAQRIPLCEPGTFKAVLDYAGMQAKVISLKPSNLVQVSQAALDRMPPATRAMVEDEQKASTILVQFDDGKQLDTCGPVSRKRLASYLEVVPGENPRPVAAKPKYLVSGQLQPTPVGHTPASSIPAASAPTSKIDTPQPSTVSQPAPAGVVPWGPPKLKLLNSDEVNAALNGAGKNHYVNILDMSLNPLTPTGQRIPSLALYMPEAILAIVGESSRKQFLRAEPTEEQKRRSLTVIAEGWVGDKVTDGCTSITRIVLISDTSGRVVQEAYLSEPLDETWRNNFGASNTCQALRAKFSLDDVERIKNSATNGEFYIAVFAGSANTKTYKIKKKHQSKLGLS